MRESSDEPDPHALERAFDRAAATYDRAAVLQREIGRRMLQRMEFIRLAPERVVDLGAGTGERTVDLRRRFRKARVIALDRSRGMLQRARSRGSWLRSLPVIRGDVRSLPLADRSVDLLFANAVFHLCRDLSALFRECQRVLRPGGLLMFTTFGPDTLRELRESWTAADDHRHVNDFVDMHDIGDALVSAWFGDPVVDVEHFRLTYATPVDVMRDLKAMGEQTIQGGRAPGLTGRGRWQRMASAYERYRDPKGRLPATCEVIYGHARATGVVPQKRADGGGTDFYLDFFVGQGPGVQSDDGCGRCSVDARNQAPQSPGSRIFNGCVELRPCSVTA
ncbi:malonyl-ACP O-methyltransferase BioC [Sediminicurvatus halobius]|uniref:Malonyl-[acyl-carrier protein] O-methyltransferase n=1 Tax=Sediminicurvatus halobius TaxID=2182432 RepID=A0A2U2MVR0_9GAMM|nr:malonyl-ACP O-methyltransferase BioC [Spiribacter halobius]PWG60948.1 malonyl-[acyl-carrier protein] O-methyltransferase BioC [Spiribacter halobius]UEX76617.1 malonyl-ACP O-methyltransferase BioC [Spiribacter halobius]